MNEYFEKVKDYLLELDFNIINENEEDGVFWVEKEDAGIHNLVIGCLDPILVMEQFLFEVTNGSPDVYRSRQQTDRKQARFEFAFSRHRGRGA